MLVALRRYRFPTAGVEITLQLGVSKTRIPDAVAFLVKQRESLPSGPTYVAFEILSPDDTFERVLLKFKWLACPETEEMFVYSNGSLTEVEAFGVPELGLPIAKQELFEDL